MRFLLISILISTMAVGAVFGLATMGHEGEHMVNCFASLAQGVLCPQFANFLDLVAFHFNVLAGLSSAIFEAVFFAIGGFALLLFGRLLLTDRPTGNFACQSRRLNAKNFSQYKSRLTRWLSLLEKRDPARLG